MSTLASGLSGLAEVPSSGSGVLKPSVPVSVFQTSEHRRVHGLDVVGARRRVVDVGAVDAFAAGGAADPVHADHQTGAAVVPAGVVALVGRIADRDEVVAAGVRRAGEDGVGLAAVLTAQRGPGQGQVAQGHRDVGVGRRCPASARAQRACVSRTQLPLGVGEHGLGLGAGERRQVLLRARKHPGCLRGSAWTVAERARTRATSATAGPRRVRMHPAESMAWTLPRARAMDRFLEP